MNKSNPPADKQDPVNRQLASDDADKADQRRSQLIDIAATLIDEHGIEAARYVKIAELAGCTRSLVYHYFPRQSDLHSAIAESFYQKLSERMSENQQKLAVVESYEGTGNTTLELLSAIFDLFEENGIAPLILRYNTELNPEYSPEAEDKWYYEDIFQSVLEDNFSVPKLDSALFIEYCFGVIKTCFIYYRKGRMTRRQAIAEIELNIGLLIARFQQPLNRS